MEVPAGGGPLGQFRAKGKPRWITRHGATRIAPEADCRTFAQFRDNRRFTHADAPLSPTDLPVGTVGRLLSPDPHRQPGVRPAGPGRDPLRARRRGAGRHDAAVAPGLARTRALVAAHGAEPGDGRRPLRAVQLGRPGAAGGLLGGAQRHGAAVRHPGRCRLPRGKTDGTPAGGLRSGFRGRRLAGAARSGGSERESGAGRPGLHDGRRQLRPGRDPDEAGHAGIPAPARFCRRPRGRRAGAAGPVGGDRDEHAAHHQARGWPWPCSEPSRPASCTGSACA